MILASLISIIATALAINKQSEACSTGNCRHRDHELKMVAKSSDSWTEFLFGNEGDMSVDRFIIDLDCPAWLRITDAYCPGDEFEVFDWGRPIGKVRLHTFDNEWSGLCEGPIKCPWKAFESCRFAHRQFKLAPGRHRITIKTLSSPIGAGHGFVQLIPAKRHHHDDYRDDDCHASNFFLVKCSVPFSQAASVCQRKGLKLAAIQTETFPEAGRMIFKGIGPQGKAWIGSFNGDNYGGGCLVYTVGTGLPSGNINLGACDQSNAVLCQQN